jgi:TRAP-type C4-dicarboxylate transport system permease small subunit
MSLETFSEKLRMAGSWLARLGAVALAAMMVVTTVDVAGRYLFNAPILGVFELTEFLVLIVIFSFLGYTQAHKGHVSVDFLMTRLPEKVQIGVDLFNHGVCLVLMGLITYMGVDNALELIEYGERSPNLAIPNYPFAFFLALGCAVMCLEFIRDLIALWTAFRGRDRS